MSSVLALPIVELSFGEWLSVQRGRAGLTQKELALKLGVSPQTVRNWEADRSRPTLPLESWDLFCGILNCNFGDIPRESND